MDEAAILASLSRKKRGQTQCPRCSKAFNNNAVPQYCSSIGCGAHLGGSFVDKSKELDAKMITQQLASVRLNQAGVPTRVFVDLAENKVRYDL